MKNNLTKFIVLLILSCSVLAKKTEVNITDIDTYTPYTSDSIVITFDQPMQRIEADKIPIRIKPNIKCYWTWIDQKNLSCNLDDYSNSDDDDYDDREDKSLQTATIYTLRIKKGLFDTNNNPLKAQTKSFAYKKPLLNSFFISDWKTPELPILTLFFNQEINEASLKGKIQLRAGESNIDLKFVNKEKNTNSGHNRFSVPFLVPVSPLKQGLDYKLFIQKGIKGLKGEVQGGEMISKGVIRAHQNFKFLSYQCENEYRRKLYASPCFTNDRVKLLFSSIIDENSAKKCQNFSQDKFKAKLGYGNQLVLALNPEINWLDKTHQKQFSDCISNLIDKFGRKIVNSREKPIIQTKGFRPTVELNWPKSTLITDKQEIKLYATSINLEKFYLHIDTINHKKIDNTIAIKVDSKRDKRIKTLLPLIVPEKDIQSISGYLSINQTIDKKYLNNWKAKGIPFNIEKSPYQINFRYNASHASVQINDIYTAEPLEGATLTLFQGSKSYHSMSDNFGIALFKLDSTMESTDFSIKITHQNKSTQLSNLNAYSTTIDKNEDTWNYYMVPEGFFDSYGLTDKPVYRPGERVKFKFYLRQKQDKNYIIPPGKYSLKVFVSHLGSNCWDTYENCHSFYVKEIQQLDEFGGFSDEFTLPKSVANGRFGISYRFKKENKNIDYTSSLAFQVSDFKNSDYKLRLETKKQNVKGREKVPVFVSASYYSGGHVPDEKGEIAGGISEIDMREAFPLYREYTFAEFEGDYQAFFLKNLNYDEQGEIHADYRPPKNDIEFGELKLNAGLKPKNGEWNYSSDLILPYRLKDYFLGLKFSSWALQVNEAIELEYILIDYKGEKHNATTVSYSIQHNNPEIPITKNQPCLNKNSESCQFELSQAGQYKVIVKASYKGKIFTRELDFYVRSPFTTKKDTEHDNDETLGIEIFSDKHNYKIGETADISLKLPKTNAQAFIIAERNSVLNTWSKKTSNGYIKLNLKITEKYAPGFDISALIQQKNKINKYSFLQNIDNSSLTIKVEEPKQDRLFSLSTDKGIYTPKEQIKLTIHSNSNSPSNYIVAVIDQSVVDLVDTNYLYNLKESSYSLSKNDWELMQAVQLSQKDDPKETQVLSQESIEMSASYYGLNYQEDHVELERIVTTGSHITREDLGAYPNEVDGVLENLLPVFSLNREQVQTKIGNIGINERDLRTFFVDSAFFKSDIFVDGKGKETIAFALPDNITQWRIIVLGTDKSGRLEFNQTAIKASKDLVLRSTLPLQLTEGDQFSAEFSVVSKQDTQTSIQTVAEVKQNNVALNTVHKKFETAKKLKSKTFSLPVDSVNQGDLIVTALAESEQNADGIQQKIAVHPAQIELSTSQYGQFDGKSKIVNFPKPKGLASASGKLSVHISTSLLPNLNPVYEYIHDYPHACWEQLSAKAIITAIEVASAKHLSSQQITEKRALVQSILDSAQDFQASNGGMGFFNGDNERVNLFLSLFTLDNFVYLQQLGYILPDNVYQRLKYFSKEIIMDTKVFDQAIPRFNEDELSPEIQLMAIKHADDLDSKVFNKTRKTLLDKMESLNLFALNQLLQAYAGEQSKQVKILGEIESKFYSTKKKFTAKTRTLSYWYLMPSDMKNQCDLISIQLQLDPKLLNKGKLLKHINGVLEGRNSNGDFGSTLENNYCAKALFDFSRKFEQTNATSAYKVRVAPKELNSDENSLETNIDLSHDVSVEINSDTAQQNYYSVTLKYPAKQETIKSQNQGFNLQRQYFVFNKGKWKKSKKFKTGDWVKTVLRIHSPIGRQFVAVSNPVPGGWLPTETALANNMPVGIRETEKASDNSSYFYQRQLNPTTTRFYADYLPAGTHTISYYSQVRNKGIFIAMPALVEEMYDDENRATTVSTRIRIK